MKKKTFKKLMSLLVAASMLATLAGCGADETTTPSSEEKSSEVVEKSSEEAVNSEVKEEEPAEDITLRLYSRDAAGTDLAEVNEAISAYVKEKLGFGIEIVQFGRGEYAKKMPLALIGSEQVDLFFTGGDDYVNYARAGALYDMTDVLADYPTLEECVYDDLLEGAKIDGRLYGMPTQKEIGNSWGYVISKEFAEEIGFDYTKATTLADMEEYIAAAYKDGRYGIMGLGNEPYMMWYDHSHQINGMFLMPADEGNDEIYHWWMSEEAEEFVVMMKDWVESGAMPADAMTNTSHGWEQEKWGARIICWSPQALEDWQVYVPMSTAWCVNGRASMTAIAAKSEYPEQCMQFLELWYTDAEFAKLFFNGIEGVNYNMVDGKVQKSDTWTSQYVFQTYLGGNMLITPLLVGDPDNKWELYEEFNAGCKLAKTATFVPDTTPVAAEIAAINAAVDEYKKVLGFGASEDPLATLEELRTALKDAGVEKVVAEFQAQWDAYKAAK